MPLPKNRSNSVRKISVRTPKGGHAVHFKRRIKGKSHSCAITGAVLQGVTGKQGVAASSRRPNRKFGGTLSSAAASRVLTLASRVNEGKMGISEVDVRLLPYVKGLLKK